MAQHIEIQQLIQLVQEKFAPDSRTEVFDVKPVKRNNAWALKGETSSRAAYNELLSEAKKRFPAVKDSIRVLPDEVIGEQCWGVIYNSVGTIHAAGRYASETVSQVLMGMPVKILDKKGGWRRIQTPEKYIGWINGSVQPMTKEELQRYNQQPKIIVTAPFTMSYSQPNLSSQPVSDLVIGNMLVVKEEKGDFYQSFYADGREAYVAKTDAQRVEDWLKKAPLSGEGIVETAFQFNGVPYVWGGTSAKGLDCSGFTKSVYFLHGVLLARDASQQVKYGKLVDDKGDFADAQPGDLVFFGEKATDENPKERVVHVGIYIGNKRFIHASDFIHVNSFDPNDSLYDAYNAGRYLRTKRVIGEVNTPGIEEFLKNEFYQ